MSAYSDPKKKPKWLISPRWLFMLDGTLVLGEADCVQLQIEVQSARYISLRVYTTLFQTYTES